jgi:hypothetical protein
MDDTDPREPRHHPGRALRIALWVIAATVVLTGFVVVGVAVLFALGVSQWASNK